MVIVPLPLLAVKALSVALALDRALSEPLPDPSSPEDGSGSESVEPLGGDE